MARTDYRTAVYNTTASHLHLQATFATSYRYEDVSYSDDGTRYSTPRFGKRTLSPLNRITDLFSNTREWYAREMHRAPLHPTIYKMLHNPDQAQYLTDWREMVLEYPHTADTNATKVAYTESDAKGIADRQTLTTLGKFIKRHAPEMPDHVLRDIVALSITSVELVFDLAGMIEAVQTGPKSCMQNSRWSEDDHPYRVYDPKYGWHMAVRREGGQVTGRCLCLTHDGEKMFVRSYRTANEGYSQSDEGMNAWLVEQGYTHENGWVDGARLARIMDGNTYVLPYIDGSEQNCTANAAYLEIDENGDLQGDRTDGYADTPEMCECNDCGASFDGDNEGTWVGRHEDYHVCGDCSSGYTYAIGRNGNEYYLNDDDVVYCNDTAYDSNYLRDNGIVYSEHDGEYYEQSECVLLDREEDWVHTDELDHRFACLDEDDAVWTYRNDAWQCAATGNWYSDNVRSDYYAEPVEGSDGKQYHADCVPEGFVLHDHHVKQYIDHTY
jgi:hypothetical protein